MMEKGAICKFGTQEGLLILLYFTLANFSQSVICYLQGPLYPPEAESKGLTPFTYGSVISFFRVVVLIGCPIFGVYAEKIGLRRAFILGIFLTGMAPALFGFLDYIDSYGWFLFFSIILRGVEAIGTVGLVCSYLIMSSIVFRGRVALAVGLVQTGFLLGISLGPLIGTFFDYYFGFTGAFLFIGTLQMLFSLLVFLTLPNLNLKNGNNLNQNTTVMETLRGYWTILKHPPIFIFIYACVSSGVGPEFMTAILEPYLRRFNLGEIGVGLMFFYMSILQLFSPIWGFSIDKSSRPELLVFIGSFIVVVSLLIVGPFPGLPLVPTIMSTTVGLVLYGLGQGLNTLSSVANLRIEIENEFSKEDLIGVSFASVGYVMASSFGGVIGPSIAGLLYEKYDFDNATLFLILVHVLVCLLIIIYTCSKQLKGTNKKKVKLGQVEDEELLGEREYLLKIRDIIRY